MLYKFLGSLYRRCRLRSLSAKLLVPIVGLMLLSLLGAMLAFVGGTALTQSHLLKQQIATEAERVIEAMNARVETVATVATLLAGDPNVVEAVQEDTETALSVLNSRAVVVRDRFGLDLIQIYDQREEERTNLVLSSLYRASRLLDQVEVGVPQVVVVKDRVLLLSRAAMPDGAGSVIAGIDLETELHRLVSRYRLSADLGLSINGAHVSTRQGLLFDAPDGRSNGQYSRHLSLTLGETPVDLLLVRPTDDVARVTRTGLTVMIGSTLLTTLLLMGLGVVIARSITQPIHCLSVAAEAVAKGDLSQQVDTTRLAYPFAVEEDEIGLLATTFNSMVAELRSLYEDLEVKVKARTRELAIAAEVARAVSTSLDMDVVLQTSVRLIHERLGFYHVGIYLIEPGSDVLVLGEAVGEAGQSFKKQGLYLTVGSRSLIGTAASTHCPRIVQDVTVEPMYLESPLLPDTRSEATIPLVVRKTAVGVLDVQSAQRDTFTPDTVKLLSSLGDQIAIGVQNAQLYAQQREHTEQLEQRVQERTAQFQAQYALLDATLRSICDGIIVADTAGEILQTNPIAQTWLTQTLSPEDEAQMRETVRGLARRAEERTEEVLELTGLDLELKVAPISEPGVEEAAAVVAVHDVSHLKALDRMRSRFVSNVSHELRTPVATIKLYAHLLQRTSPEEKKWEEYLDRMAKEADWQARLVEDILQISHIDAGRLDIKPCATSLNELTEAVIDSHQVLALERGLTLGYRPAEPGTWASDGPGVKALGPMAPRAEASVEPLVALVDSDRMTQVLNNLVGNAIRYTPEGGKVVVSTGKKETKGRMWATVTVLDTGIGIPKEELPQIFGRFFRGEQPRLMQTPGTGLGLAIVKEIVGLHGGRVTVESQVGEGSAFTVWLPLADWTDL